MSMSWPSKADVGGLFQLDLNYHVTFRRSSWGFVLGTNQFVLVHRLWSCFVMLQTVVLKEHWPGAMGSDCIQYIGEEVEL